MASAVLGANTLCQWASMSPGLRTRPPPSSTVSVPVGGGAVGTTSPAITLPRATPREPRPARHDTCRSQPIQRAVEDADISAEDDAAITQVPIASGGVSVLLEEFPCRESLWQLVTKCAYDVPTSAVCKTRPRQSTHLMKIPRSGDGLKGHDGASRRRLPPAGPPSTSRQGGGLLMKEDSMPAAPTGRGSIELIGAFESTYLPAHDRDIMETTGHDTSWKQDLQLLAATGVKRLRYPVRWHRVEAEDGKYDWSSTDRVLHYLRDQGFEPIVDLVHHTSYPRWLSGGF